MKFNDFRVPVEYIVDQYWRKKQLKNNVDIEDDEDFSGKLPEYPFHIVRDLEKKCKKIIYDEGGKLEWSEELIRNWKGKVTRIKVTLPKINEDEDFYYIDLVRNDEDKVEFGEVND